MTRIAVLYHSIHGHTEVVAKCIHKGAASVESVESDRGRESRFNAPPPSKLSKPISGTQLSSQWFPVGD